MNNLPQKKYLAQVDAVVSRDTSKQLIAGLFATLQSQSKGGLTSAVVENYLDAVSEIPEWAVTDAAAMYRTGRRGSGKFVPMAGELAKCALELVEAKKEREAHKASMQSQARKISEQISEQNRLKDFQAQKSPESIKRVGELREKQRLEWEREAAEFEAAAKPEISITKITQNRFAAEGRALLIKTLEAQNV